MGLNSLDSLYNKQWIINTFSWRTFKDLLRNCTSCTDMLILGGMLKCVYNALLHNLGMHLKVHLTKAGLARQL